MSKQIVSVAVVLLGWAALPAAAGELNVGDPAPPLAVKEFVKGDPVKSMQKGKTYVVEFWATWCGPCKTSIPHLTELQKKHKDVVFIGVSVFEHEPKGVKPFVEEMGAKMDYRVAMDDVANAAKPGEGAMAKTWMDAASQGGIPTAFIINGDGKVAWIGHPVVMDKPLEQIEAGKWDLAAATKEFKEQIAQTRKLKQVREKLAKAGGDSKEVLAILEQTIADDPKLETQLGMMKFKALTTEASSADKALEYGKHLVDTVFHENAQALNFVAWGIVDPDAKTKPDAKLLKLALQAAQRADELAKGKDGAIADTLAKAYFDNGDAAKALETQERALKLAEGTPIAQDPGLKGRLEQYKRAAKKE